MIKGTTGLDLNKEDMRSIAGAITNNARRFNLREGLTPKDDKLPKRFNTEKLPETGKVITEKQMERLLADYYQTRGWDERGRPPKQASKFDSEDK